MKKFLALILAMLMIASMSITAFAVTEEDIFAGTNNSEGSAEITEKRTENGEVKVVAGGTPVEIVYNVDVTWKTMTFMFSFDPAAVWDPSTHTYVNGSGSVGQWYYQTGVDGENKPTFTPGATMKKAIVIMNHSNATVETDAYFSLNGTTPVYEAKKENVTATVSLNEANDSKNVLTAEGTESTMGPTVAYDVTVSGIPTQDSEFEVGKITVVLTKTALNGTTQSGT